MSEPLYKDPFATALFDTLSDLSITISEATAYLGQNELLAAIGTLAGTFEAQTASVNAALLLIRNSRRKP